MEIRKAVLAFLVASALVGLVAIWIVAREPDPQRAGVGSALGDAPAAQAPETLRFLEAGSNDGRTAVAGAWTDPQPASSEIASQSAAPSRWMRARIVDEHGAPLAGASMSLPDWNLATKSGPDGSAEFAVPLAQVGAQTSISLDFTAEGRTAEQRWIDLRPEGDCHAGEVALLPAGSLFGRVVDSSGSPLVVVVQVCSPIPALSEQDRERMEALGTGLGWRGPMARSKQDGSFHIDAVAVGSCIVAARKPGSLYSWSETLVVQAGQVVDAGTLVVRSPGADQRIEGVVLDADGKPAAARTVQLWRPGVARNVDPQVQTASTGPEGRFHFAVPRSAVLHVILLDALEREEIARIEDVSPGGPPLVLRVPPLRSVELVIRSADGEPVEKVRFNLSDADGFGMFGNRARIQAVQSGIWLLELPPRPFRLWVSAAGYEALQTELLDPAATPERIELTLQADTSPRIRCVVTKSGAPVAQAQIVAYRLLEGPHHLNTGFSTRLDSQAFAMASACAEAGTYELRVKREGTIALLVLEQERIVLEHGPIHVGPGDIDREIDLALPELASIEGRVLLAEGRDPAGLLIAASRGDGAVRALTLGSDPGFRFERLAPGAWQVRQMARLTNPHLLEDRRAYSDQEEPSWDVVLEPGQAARFDIDLRHEALCRIRGRVRLTPEGPVSWRVGLRNEFGSVQPDGTFQADSFQLGAASLTLWGSYDPRTHLLISEQLDLTAGETKWVLDLLTAELELTGVPAFESELRRPDTERFRLQWTDSGSRKGTLKILSHSGGTLLLRGLPPGRWTFETRDAEDGSEGRVWRSLGAAIELAPGDRQTLAL
jgi:hypothetical protein